MVTIELTDREAYLIRLILEKHYGNTTWVIQSVNLVNKKELEERVQAMEKCLKQIPIMKDTKEVKKKK